MDPAPRGLDHVGLGPVQSGAGDTDALARDRRASRGCGVVDHNFDARAEGHRRRSQRAGTQIEKLYRHVSFQIALHSP